MSYLTNSLYDDNVKNLQDVENSKILSRNTSTGVLSGAPGCFLNIPSFNPSPFNNIPGDLTKVEDNLRGYSRLSRNRAVAQNPCNECSNKTCDCLSNQSMNRMICTDNSLAPIHSRLDKKYYDFTVNRFTPLFENSQDLSRISDNSRIGINTRLLVKDNYKPIGKK